MTLDIQHCDSQLHFYYKIFQFFVSWFTDALFIPHYTFIRYGCCVTTFVLASIAYWLPTPSHYLQKKVAMKLRENIQLKGQGFIVVQKEWEMNYFRRKAIIF